VLLLWVYRISISLLSSNGIWEGEILNMCSVYLPFYPKVQSEDF
jgi:hypothetical protein